MGSEKSERRNDGTDLLNHRAKFGGNRTTQVGVRRQRLMDVYFSVTLLPVDDVGNVVQLVSSTT